MRTRNLLWLGLFLAGCGQFPNPNDLATIPAENRAGIAYKRLDAVEDTLDYKVTHNEITDEQRNDLIRELCEDMLKTIDPSKVPYADQWMYATLLRVTDRWKDAEVSLKEAVRVADSPDRKVNDTLKLSLAEAKNGEIEESLKTANSVMDVADKDAAPILPSVLYEIVPALEGKGHDKELADILAKAIECHKRVKVDQSSDAGRQFLIARRYHIQKAQKKIEQLTGHATT